MKNKSIYRSKAEKFDLKGGLRGKRHGNRRRRRRRNLAGINYGPGYSNKVLFVIIHTLQLIDSYRSTVH